MPTIQVEANVTGRDLLKAAEQLDSDELRKFVEDVLALRAGRQAPRLSARETELLLKINEGLPEAMRTRLSELTTKRRAQILTPEEHAELLRLTGEVEGREAERAAALAELAQLRKTLLAELMKALGIQAPAHE